MNDLPRQWDSANGLSWAKLLGMVHVPMFGGRNMPGNVQEAAVLLDGNRGSFAFLRTDDADFPMTTNPLSWSWSSCVRHIVTVLPDSHRMYIRRWDEPLTVWTSNLPSLGMEAVSLLGKFEAVPEARRPNVIRCILEPFRRIRSRIDAQNPLLAVQLLNGILLVAETVLKPKRPKDIRGVRSFKDAFKLLSQENLRLCGVADLPSSVAALSAADLLRDMVAPDPYTGCQLHPTLLFRHAASKLYQEAHLEIERNPQGYFPGFEPTCEPVPVGSPRDVRFTPANLARALVQKTLDVLPDGAGQLTILDPACGSGVFLVEAIREITGGRVASERKIKVVGYDISEISEYTTRFCLEYAAHSKLSSGKIKAEVLKHDSLDHPWVNADIILMNPPFIPWERLSDEQRRQVGEELGEVLRRRPDIAMAFISKAVRHLKPGGVLGCVLPAPLLTSQTGLLWRKQLSEQGRLHLLACFEGYKYFPTSLVETAFLVYQRRGEGERTSGTTEILISDEGYEDAALRTLRRDQETDLSIEGVERFSCPSQVLSPEDWRPLHRDAYKERDRLSNLALPRIADLFEIRQGVRTGDKPVFVLSAEQYEALESKEKGFFRPAAGGGSIQDGQLLPRMYVFYPYAPDGSLLCSSEEELEHRMPNYYRYYLAKAKTRLARRPRFAGRPWWELSERLAWQLSPAPHIISAYFGASGSFAFDELGQYITVNGHAWCWARGTVVLSDGECVPFEQTPAVWAYLAILNSGTFAKIVSLFSVRLQGGQFRLERRYLSRVPLPDVTDEMAFPIDVLTDLVTLGRAIHAGRLREVASDLERRVSLLYGLG